MSTGRADASLETTSKAVAGRDKRVDYGFCVSQLSAQNGSAAADAWGLAKVAAKAGRWSIGGTENEINAMLQDPHTDPRANGALGQCLMLYHHANHMFGTAWSKIDEGDYEGAKTNIALVATLVRDCDGSFAGAKLRSPFTMQSAESVQLAIICTAIIDLIGR